MIKELKKITEGLAGVGKRINTDEILVIQIRERLNPSYFDVFDSTNKEEIYVLWDQLYTILQPGEEVEVHSNIGCHPTLLYIKYLIQNKNGKVVKIRLPDSERI